MKKHKKIRLCFRLGVLLAVVTWVLVPVSAEEESVKTPSNEEMNISPHTYQLEELVISARSDESVLASIAGGTDMIDTGQVLKTQPISISNTLSRLPGLDISSDAPWGSDLNIRGLTRDAVSLLVDGCIVNTSTDINARFGLVNPLEIEHVEVIKGPISSLYGSGSIGGMVNILTKKGRFVSSPEWHSDVTSVYAGNPRGMSMYANTSYNRNDYWVYASGSRRDHESYASGNGDEVQNSQFDDHHGKFAIGHIWNRANLTEFQIQSLKAHDVGIPGTGTAPLPTISDVTYPETTWNLINLSHTIFPDGETFVESNIKAYYQKVERGARIDNLPEQSPKAQINPSADHDTWGLSWKNLLNVYPHTFFWGLDARNWHMKSVRSHVFKEGRAVYDKPTPEADQLLGGIFLDGSIYLNPVLLLSLGARLDYVRLANKAALPMWDCGMHENLNWNSHINFRWYFTTNGFMELIGSSGYRSPNILERFKYLNLAGGVVKRGNPQLDPERSVFFEYVLHYATSDLQFSTSIYANTIADLVIDQKIADGLYQSENVNRAEIFGVEAKLWRPFLKNWSLDAVFSYTEGKDKTADERLPCIPPLNGLIGIRYDNSNGFWGSVETIWAARQNKIPSGEQPTGSWATLNIRLGYRFNIHRYDNDIILGIDNITGKDYHNYLATSRGVELKAPGQNVMVAWRIGF